MILNDVIRGEQAVVFREVEHRLEVFWFCDLTLSFCLFLLNANKSPYIRLLDINVFMVLAFRQYWTMKRRGML